MSKTNWTLSQSRRKRSYWKRRLEREGIEMLRHEPVPMTPPAAGFVLVAKRQLRLDGAVYPCGSVVPVAALGKNYQAMLDARFICWSPPSTQPRPSARAAPPPAPPPSKPVPVFVDNANVYLAWCESVKATMEKNAIGEVRAREVLQGSRAGRDFYLTAQRAGCVAEAKRLGRWSVSPDRVKYL
jgi:hypothetical protein